MIKFKHFLEGNGLWANIHKKRKEGRPMRKPGSKGAPTKKDFDSARGEGVNEVINLDDADTWASGPLYIDVDSKLSLEYSFISP